MAKAHVGEEEEECFRPAQLLKTSQDNEAWGRTKRQKSSKLKNTTFCALTFGPGQRHLADIQLFVRGNFWLHQAGGCLA